MTPDSAQEKKHLKARTRFLNVWTLVGAILVAAVVIFLLDVLSVPVAILIWTVVIVFCLRGIVNGLDARGVNRTLGTAIAYVAMFAVIGLVGLLMFSPMFGLNAQITSLVESVPQLVNNLIAWGNDVYARYAPMLEDQSVRNFINDAQGSLASWASSFAQVSASGIVDLGAGVANGLMAVGFALVIAFWVLMELPAIGRETTRLIGPKHADDAKFLHYTFTRIMGGYIKATLLQCAIIGAACGVLFAVVGLPNAAALGVITGVLNIIPIIGPWLGGAVAAVTAVFVSPLVALVALLGTIVIQQFVYTFISPRIMGGSVDVHPALTLLALMAGSALGGAMSGLSGSLVGMLASIPAVAVLKACFVYYFEKKTGRHLVAEDGVFFKGTPAQGDVPDPMADATSPHPGTTASFLPVELDEKGQPTGRLRRISLKSRARKNPAHHSHDERPKR
ncbi:MAG: AI-2E family transporter [Eggerthellaceae bacterium]|nr:AI-2E family transporter [Eggerthellaceae bacterium]